MLHWVKLPLLLIKATYTYVQELGADYSLKTVLHQVMGLPLGRCQLSLL